MLGQGGYLPRSYSGLTMRLISPLSMIMMVAVSAPALSQDASMIDRLNASIREVSVGQKSALGLDHLPEWGVAVKDPSGEVVDLFGQVQYDVTPAGNVVVPGYVAPMNTQLEVVSQNEWAKLSTGQLQPQYKPLTDLPGAVGKATDFLANEFCGKKNRPSIISLSLVAGVEGTIYFATAKTEVGSNVTWEFREDICPRYGLEGENIGFR